MNRLRQLYAELTAALARLTPREQGLLALTAGAVFFFIVVVTSFSVSRSVTTREARIRTKLTQLEDISRLTVDYRALESQRRELEDRLRNNPVQLFSYFEDLSKRHGVDLGGINDKGSQPSSVDPKIIESSVEVPLMRIPLDKLVRLLSDVESGPGIVKIRRLQIRPRGDEPVIDAWLVATTYKLENS